MRTRALLFVLALSACTAPIEQQRAPQPAQVPMPQPVPAPVPAPGQLPVPAEWQWYQGAAQAGQAVYEIDTNASLITVTVRRGGPMARLGHDHVVASRSVQGFVAPDAGRADFQFRLDQLQVDEAGLRQEAGLTTVPTADAIEGTRTNMLTRVLDAGRFPMVTLHVDAPQGPATGASAQPLRLRIRLHGVERTMEVATTVERHPAGLTASGSFMLNQTDFGITPMSVLGGAIVVMDQLEIKFRLLAHSP